jgi:hypothetical protein
MLGRVAVVRTDIVFLRSVGRLLVTANALPSLPILVTLMTEALNSSETSILIIGTRRNIPEDSILQFISSAEIQTRGIPNLRHLAATSVGDKFNPVKWKLDSRRPSTDKDDW